MSAACARIHGLRRTPRPTNAPADTTPETLDNLLGLDTITAAENRDVERARALETSSQSAKAFSPCSAVRP